MWVHKYYENTLKNVNMPRKNTICGVIYTLKIII